MKYKFGRKMCQEEPKSTDMNKYPDVNIYMKQQTKVSIDVQEYPKVRLLVPNNFFFSFRIMKKILLPEQNKTKQKNPTNIYLIELYWMSHAENL